MADIRKEAGVRFERYISYRADVVQTRDGVDRPALVKLGSNNPKLQCGKNKEAGCHVVANSSEFTIPLRCQRSLTVWSERRNERSRHGPAEMLKKEEGGISVLITLPRRAR
jgi:hypothetical protein